MDTTDDRRGLPSASGIARLAACPGSLRMTRNLPDRPTADSDFGTKVHEYLAGRLKAEDLTPEMLDLAESCQAIEAKVVAQWKARYEIPEGAEIMVHRDNKRMWLERDGERLCSGLGDAIYVWGRFGLCIDYKTLPGDHKEAPDNLQLRCLVVLTVSEHGWMKAMDVGIIQPLVTHTPLICSYDTDTIIQAQNELLGILAEANKPDAPLIPGEQCRFCRANDGTCPVARKEVEDLSMLTINASGLTISDEDIASLADRCGPALKMIGSIKAEVYRRVEANPDQWRARGFEIREGAGKRAVTDVATVANRLEERGASMNDIAAKCSITIKNVEAITRAATGAKGMGLKKATDEILAGCVAVKTGKPTLKRIGIADEEEYEEPAA